MANEKLYNGITPRNGAMTKLRTSEQSSRGVGIAQKE
jgi:hypothetical protein